MGLFDMSAEDFLKGLYWKKSFIVRRERQKNLFGFIQREGKQNNDIEWESWIDALTISWFYR